MRRVGIFCGSSFGGRREYRDAAEALGHALVDRRVGLVYGGGDVGLMGRIAETVVNAGDDVIGVIPRMLVDKELAFEGLSDLRVVGSMQERKELMARLSDGFIAMPGGLGTIDELVEMLTWTQLDIHQKPCGLLNVRGYFDRLLAFLDHSVDERFLQPEHRAMILVEEDPAELLERLMSCVMPNVDKTKWILGIEEDPR